LFFIPNVIRVHGAINNDYDIYQNETSKGVPDEWAAYGSIVAEHHENGDNQHGNKEHLKDKQGVHLIIV
jgi:hypothetical protein